jgi:NadR type nicotinamide-nucleotide adenylyltransferase
MEKGPEENNRILKIAITGPESTGKSMLAEQLAKHFNTVWVPEHAREYISKLKRKYEQEDILHIAKGQLEREDQALLHAKDFLFCDTEFLVTKIWSEHAFGNCDPWIQKKFTTHIYDLYLLMDVDLPWEYDPQREHPHLRSFFLNWYKNELTKHKLPFRIISDSGEKRTLNAINSIFSFFEKIFFL